MTPILNFPYDLNALTWLDVNHTRNKENTYCYCGKDLAEDESFIRCDKCTQKFHCDCVRCLQRPLIMGDVFYKFTCSVCAQGSEQYSRESISWATITHLVLYHLMVTNRKKEFFRWKEDICKLIDNMWGYLNAGKHKSPTWHNTVASVLSTHADTFASGTEKFSQPGWWTLKELAPPDKKKPTKDTRPSKRKAQTEGEKTRLTRTPAIRETDKKRKQMLYTDSESETQLKERSSPIKKKKKKPRETASPRSPSSESLSELSDLSSDSSDEVVPATKSEKSPRHVQKSKMGTPVSAKSSTKQTWEFEDDNEQSSAKGSKPKKNKKSQNLAGGSPVRSGPGKSTAPSGRSVARQSPKGSAPNRKQPQTTPGIKVKQEDLAVKPSKATVRSSKGKAQRANLAVITKLNTSENMTSYHPATGSSKEPTPKPSEPEPEMEYSPATPVEIELESIPYYSSFASRLYGDPRRSSTLTAEKAWMSPWRGRKLKPYIWRDYESYPLKAQLLDEIQVHYTKKQGNDPNDLVLPRSPIDFCYFQKEHLTQVNELLSRRFWPGIDMSEALLYPEFSVVVLYRCLVIGCAFMTPEAYITYVAVDSGWEGAGIGAFMLYHLIQTSVGLDVTLHVSANNPAMLLYQKFGFKPEQFIVKFYDKYLPESSWACKNAFLVRRRR